MSEPVPSKLLLSRGWPIVVAEVPLSLLLLRLLLLLGRRTESSSTIAPSEASAAAPVTAVAAFTLPRSPVLARPLMKEARCPARRFLSPSPVHSLHPLGISLKSRNRASGEDENGALQGWCVESAPLPEKYHPN